VNVIIVSVTILALVLFVGGGLPSLREMGTEHLLPLLGGGVDQERGPIPSLLYATALMFVAYTGYGRIATLGEEVRDPGRTIPRAIVLTLAVSATLYVTVGLVAVGSVGSGFLARATSGEAAPLEVVAGTFALPGVAGVVALGAITAMLGVSLNLILGLSRVLLAMGRRGDMPRVVARLDEERTTPWVAVSVIGILVAGLASVGSVEITWSFSAFTVLLYYAITNLAALQLSPEERLFPRAFAWAGLFGCLFLAFWVDLVILVIGLALVGAGLLWHLYRRRGR
jgi:APA family basic amino acid/polyamine antiporter